MISQLVFGRVVHRHVRSKQLRPSDAEHGSGELRINLRQLRCHDVAQQSQSLVTGRRRDLNNFWAIIREAGVLCDLRDAMTRMDALQPEPLVLAVEAKEAAIR